MQPMRTIVKTVDHETAAAHIGDLSVILAESVADGAAIGFMQPFSIDDAMRFWTDDVLPHLAKGRRALFIAESADQLIGAVQLITALPPNQPHRCEVAKMAVRPAARRKGAARALMDAVLEHAAQIGKTLITLDTRTGDAAEKLYASVGFGTAGVIPDFARDADGAALHATTYMYKRL